MLFIVRGNIGSSYRLRHNRTSKCVLGPSHFCGDELISWCLSKPLRDNLPLSTTTLTTLTVTEAFALDALDLKYLTQHFQHKFANENLKRAVRSHSCSWQTWAAVTIQLGWRRHRARLSLSNTIATTTPDHSYADDHSETVSINAQHDPSSRFPLTPPLRAQLRSLRLYAAILCSPKPKDYLSS